LRIPRRPRAADTNLPVRVLHGRNDPAAMEHPIGLYPERRPPLLHGERVSLGERARQCARASQDPRNVRTTQRHRPIQNLARREGLENDTGSVNHESAPYQTAVSSNSRSREMDENASSSGVFALLFTRDPRM